MKKLLIFVTALAMLLALPASALAQGGGGTLVGGFDVGPGGLSQTHPWIQTAGNTWLIKIWSPLVSYNEDISGLAPQLATEWSSNDDSTVWTFNLREGVVWHDGEPFTADDVRFTFEFVLSPGSTATAPVGMAGIKTLLGAEAFSAGEAESIEGINVIDDLTIELTLAVPDPRFPYKLVEAYILPEHAIDFPPEDIATAEWWFSTPIGTGPFMHDEFVRDQFWAVVPNPNYWNGAPKLDRLINRYFEDETAATLALEAGEIQFTYVSGDVALRLAENDNYVIYQGPSGVTNYLIFNMREERFQDVRVRQAFLYAIDREAIAEIVLGGTATVVPCLAAYPAMWPEEYNDYAYNPDLARQLLEEAGWSQDEPIEIVTYYDSQFHADAMAAMQQFLADVGIETVPRVDAEGYNSYFYTGEGWSISYRGLGHTAGSYPFQYYETGGYPDAVGDAKTLSGASYPELDELIAQARSEADPDAYMGLLQDICAFQNENAIEGSLWTAIRFAATTNDVQDFYWFPGPAGGPYEDHAELWTVAAE
jgi:peptide/nickel transport system substrate-binding protein